MIDFATLDGISVGESFEDGSLTFEDSANPSATFNFIVRGTNDPYLAYVATLNHLRGMGLGEGVIAYQGIPLNSISVSRKGCSFAFDTSASFAIPDNSSDSGGNNRASQRGTSPDNPVINDDGFVMPSIEPSDFQFSTVGGISHLTHGYFSTSYVAAREDSTLQSPKYYDEVKFGNGIGWNGESFDGVDVVTPSETFSIQISAPKRWVTPEYRTLISSMTGCTNNLSWFGYEANCVLFRGLTASSTALNYTDPFGNTVNDWYWRLRFEFEARRGVYIPAPSVKVTVQGEKQEIGHWRHNGHDRALAVVLSDILNMDTEGATGTITRQSDFSMLRSTIIEYCTSHNKKRTFQQSLLDSLDQIQELLAENEPASIYKPGYFYIWFRTQKNIDSETANMFPVTEQANLVQVYPSVDFNMLNLPDQSW